MRTKRKAQGLLGSPPPPPIPEPLSLNCPLDKALDQLAGLTEAPETFCLPPTELAQTLTVLVKLLHDHAKKSETLRLGPLEELIIEGFDTESIWEELQLRNPGVNRFVKKVIKRLTSLEKPQLVVAEQQEASEGEGATSEDQEEEEEEDDDDDGSYQEALVSGGSEEEEEEEENEEEDEEGEEEGEEEEGLKKDRFFDMEEMERFAEEAEREEMEGGDDDDGEDDEEEEESEEELGRGLKRKGEDEIKFEDFYGDEEEEEEEGEDEEGALLGKGGRWDEEEEEGAMMEQGDEEEDQQGVEGMEEEEEADLTTMTPFEREQYKKKKEIQELERELLAERPWELRGEVKAKERPENSLLEAVVDVERATRAPVLMTAEKCASIEEMIKKRILDENFDDVVPKEIAGDVLFNKRSKEDLPEVSQEKSKEGLGEIYEKEYLRLAMGVETETEESKAKVQMAALFKKLCLKLDALSNFHFTPKPVDLDLSVKPNVPAIAMEEVIPLAVSQAQTQAPEEVHEKKRGREGVLRDASEMDRDERKRLRGAKKTARRKARKQKAVEEKLVHHLNPGLGNKYAKEKLRRELEESKKYYTKGKEVEKSGREYTTSSKFFAKLQDEVQSHGGLWAKNKGKKGEEKEKKGKKASALKL